MSHNLLNMRSMEHHDDISDSDSSLISVAITPTASDCLSVVSDCESTGEKPKLVPVRRDPTKIIERLHAPRRRHVGKRKLRRMRNDASLARLVEEDELEDNLWAVKSRSAFAQLLESPVKMMIWCHFINLSEEAQEEYLNGTSKDNEDFEKQVSLPSYEDGSRVPQESPVQSDSDNNSDFDDNFDHLATLNETLRLNQSYQSLKMSDSAKSCGCQFSPTDSPDCGINSPLNNSDTNNKERGETGCTHSRCESSCSAVSDSSTETLNDSFSSFELVDK